MGLMSKKRTRNKSTGRNYQTDLNYESSPEQVKKRENRNKARRTLMAKGKVKKGDKKDVIHRDGNALDNKPSNWGVQSMNKNRSYPRVDGAHKKYADS